MKTNWTDYKIPEDGEWNGPWADIDRFAGRVLNVLAAVGMFSAFVCVCFVWGYLS